MKDCHLRSLAKSFPPYIDFFSPGVLYNCDRMKLDHQIITDREEVESAQCGEGAGVIGDTSVPLVGYFTIFKDLVLIS